MSVENLRAVYRQASVHELDEGRHAYTRYNRILWRMALRRKVAIDTACGVFAALSPNNGYLANVSDAEACLGAAQMGGTIDSFVVHTYGANKRKAWEIARGGLPEDVLRGDKVRAFYDNLMFPHHSTQVTVDGHMRNAWAGERLPLKGIPAFDYEQIARDVCHLARDVVYAPCQVQAILWVTWRRLHSVTRPQLTLWDEDLERAGLGFDRL